MAEEHPLLGDAAKRRTTEDEFGLSEIVASLSKVILSRVAADGYAIGIEGKWGSGKTTLLNFVEETIKSKNDPYKKVIRFDPWLIGNKRTLLNAFFAELNVRIEELRSDATVRDKIGKAGLPVLDRLGNRLEQYAAYVDLAAATASGAAVVDPSLFASWIAFILKGLAAVQRFLKKPPPSLEGLREQIVGDLEAVRKLLPGTRLVVLIDDTDRLDPEEAVEILRLIKAVANFPLVTYLVCFDRAILAKQVLRVIQVGNGEDYLEKIFQQIVPVPPQEPFALRRFVRRRLVESFPSEMSPETPADLEFAERSDIVFDKWVGKLVHTPRDAIRLCENVKFGWPYLKGNGSFLDYAWLQLIKLSHQALYDWTQTYVTNLGSYRDGGRPGDGEAEREARALRNILKDMDWGRSPFGSGITILLPGLKDFANDIENAKAVYNFAPSTELADFEANKRLGSPSHWRFYFAFGKPSYALSDAELSAFWRMAATDWRAAAESLREFFNRSHQRRGFYLDVLLDRLGDRLSDAAPEQQVGLARALAEMMDELPRVGPTQFSDVDPWRSAAKLLSKSAGSHFNDIATNGRSLNWLAVVMRDQGFALGVTSSNISAPERQWLTRDQFDEAMEAIQKRFEALGLEGILAMPEAATILYCWVQLGDAKKLRELIAAYVVDDAKFIELLEAMRNWVNSSDQGLYQKLDTDVVQLFMDASDTKDRLNDLASSTSVSSEIRKEASDLLSRWGDRIRKQ